MQDIQIKERGVITPVMPLDDLTTILHQIQQDRPIVSFEEPTEWYRCINGAIWLKLPENIYYQYSNNKWQQIDYGDVLQEFARTNSLLNAREDVLNLADGKQLNQELLESDGDKLISLKQCVKLINQATQELYANSIKYMVKPDPFATGELNLSATHYEIANYLNQPEIKENHPDGMITVSENNGTTTVVIRMVQQEEDNPVMAINVNSFFKNFCYVSSCVGCYVDPEGKIINPLEPLRYGYENLSKYYVLLPEKIALDSIGYCELVLVGN